MTNPRPISITVVIDNDIGDGSFRLLSNPVGNGVPIAQGFVVQFDNNQGGQYSDGFLVSFELPENQGKNGDWVFAADPPIWVKPLDNKGACPKKKGDHKDGILSNPTLTNGLRTLTVTNENSSKQYFGFALRFKNTENGKRLAYDPIGDNQNGSVKSFDWAYVTVGVASGIASALVTTGTLFSSGLLR